MDGPVRLIRSQNVHNDRFHAEKLVCIDDLQASRLDNVRVQAGDVLLNITGDSVARSCQVPTDVLPARVNQHVAILRSNPKRLNNSFLRYVLISPGIQKELLSLARSGGTRNALTKRDLASFQIQIPRDVETQAKVASILSTLDDRIELNRRMCETLEAIAQALFKSWFIDFDPVRAKMEDRDTGLPDHIADLFPDRLVDSTLGPIPCGWQAKPLSALAQFLNGLAMQKYPPVGEGRLPVLKIAQLRAGHMARADFVRDDIDDKYVVVAGDIVFSWSGSLECMYWTGGPAALNQHLFRVLPRQHPPWLCYSAILHHLTRFREVAADKATTMGHIQRRHLDEALLAVPSADALESLDMLMAPLMQRTVQLNLISRNLAGFRDTMLMHLMTGHSDGGYVVSRTALSSGSEEASMIVQLVGKMDLG